MRAFQAIGQAAMRVCANPGVTAGSGSRGTAALAASWPRQRRGPGSSRGRVLHSLTLWMVLGRDRVRGREIPALTPFHAHLWSTRGAATAITAQPHGFGGARPVSEPSSTVANQTSTHARAVRARYASEAAIISPGVSRYCHRGGRRNGELNAGTDCRRSASALRREGYAATAVASAAAEPVALPIG
jgi:hypothetical protein